MINDCKAEAAYKAGYDKDNISSSTTKLETLNSSEHLWQYALCGGANGYEKFVNTFCLCISPDGVVYQSKSFWTNLSYILYSSISTTYNAADRERPFLWEPVCEGQGTVVYNANDYLTNFGQMCSAYTTAKVCEMEDDIDKILKLLKKGKKSKGKKSRKYSGKYRY